MNAVQDLVESLGVEEEERKKREEERSLNVRYFYLKNKYRHIYSNFYKSYQNSLLFLIPLYKSYLTIVNKAHNKKKLKNQQNSYQSLI